MNNSSLAECFNLTSMSDSRVIGGISVRCAAISPLGSFGTGQRPPQKFMNR